MVVGTEAGEAVWEIKAAGCGDHRTRKGGQRSRASECWFGSGDTPCGWPGQGDTAMRPERWWGHQGRRAAGAA